MFFPPYTLKTQSVVAGGKACEEGAWGEGPGQAGQERRRRRRISDAARCELGVPNTLLVYGACACVQV